MLELLSLGGRYTVSGVFPQRNTAVETLCFNFSTSGSWLSTRLGDGWYYNGRASCMIRRSHGRVHHARLGHLSIREKVAFLCGLGPVAILWGSRCLHNSRAHCGGTK